MKYLLSHVCNFYLKHVLMWLIFIKISYFIPLCNVISVLLINFIKSTIYGPVEYRICNC